MSDSLLWAAAGAAAVYLLWVRPLQQRASGDARAGAAGEEGGTLASVFTGAKGGLFSGTGILSGGASSSSASSGGCGCGGDEER